MTPYPALQARLNMLQEDLGRVLSGLDKLDKELDDLGLLLSKSKSNPRDVLMNRAKSLTNKIKSLRDLKMLSQPIIDTWRDYGVLRDQSDQLYREFLEIFGGVAIRRREIDEKMCVVAQELLVGSVVDAPALTILATGDNDAPSLARIMRIRFSDRAVWTLPLTAHQFAQVVIEDKDNEDLKNYANKKAEAEVPPLSPETTDAELRRKEDARRRKTVDSAESRWKQLMADCIALYILGPCYAGSALLFRFSPVAGVSEHDTQAPDIERAYVCLEMLRSLDEKASIRKPYSEFIDWLGNLWKQMLGEASNANALSQERKDELRAFVKNVYELLDYNLPGAQYPAYKEKDLGGWSVAREWVEGWEAAKKDSPGRMQVPKVSASNKVRDALNAAWLYRSRAGEEVVAELTDVVRTMCNQIVQQSKPSEDRTLTATATGPSSSPLR